MECLFYVRCNLHGVLVAVIARAATTAIDKIVMTLRALCLGVALVFKVHSQQGLANATVRSKPLC